jgi:hypothetical protein
MRSVDYLAVSICNSIGFCDAFSGFDTRQTEREEKWVIIVASLIAPHPAEFAAENIFRGLSAEFSARRSAPCFIGRCDICRLPQNVA